MTDTGSLLSILQVCRHFLRLKSGKSGEERLSVSFPKSFPDSLAGMECVSAHPGNEVPERGAGGHPGNIPQSTAPPGALGTNGQVTMDSGTCWVAHDSAGLRVTGSRRCIGEVHQTAAVEKEANGVNILPKKR